MATTTTNTRGWAPMAACLIEFNSDNIIVRNPDTGREVKVTRAQFNRLPWELKRRIDCDEALDAPVQLSLEEREAILRVSRDADLTPATTTPPVTVTTPVVATVAVTNNTAQMVARSASLNHTVIRRETERRQQNVQVFDKRERKVAALQEQVNVAGEKLYLMFYDIPDQSGVANPSLDLWRMGFCRFQLSAWLAHERTVSNPYFQRWVKAAQAKGCKIDLYEQSEATRERMIADCQKQLENYLREMHTSLIQSIANADERLKAAIAEAQELQSAGGTEEATKKRDGVVRAAINSAAKRLESAIACAERFDATETIADLIEAMREATKAQAEAFNVHARAVGIKVVTV